MMRFISVLRRLWREERGITAALMAIFMTGLVGMSAVAVDVGVMFTAKAQLQNAADSAALAAADTMLGMDAQNNAVAQPSTGLGSAQQYSAANKAIGVSVALKTPRAVTSPSATTTPAPAPSIPTAPAWG